MIEVIGQESTRIASSVIVILSLFGAVWSYIARDRQATRPALLVFTTTLSGALAIILGGMLGYGLLMASALLAWKSARIASGTSVEISADLSPRVARLLILPVVVALVGLTCYRLDTYTGSSMTWESPVIVDLLSELDTEKSIEESVLERLKWNHGVLSGGASSMVFGLPALLGLKFIRADFLLLRMPSAVAFLGGCFAIFLVTRKRMGMVAAVSALSFFSLNQVVLIYARYGSSAAGSLCALLFALFACVRLVQTRRLLWAPISVVCLYAATLGYAPARVPVLLMVIMTPIGIWASESCSIRRRAVAFMAFLLSLAPIILFQIQSDAIQYYFAARGEQFFGLLLSKYWPDPIRALQSVALSTKPLSPGETIGVAIELVRQVTGPQLLALIDPLWPEIKRASPASILPFHDDPPFLKIISPAIMPMVILGICGCVRARHYWLCSLLLAWLIGGCGSALLSNRVDDHRLLFTVIPLSIFAACGVSLFVQAWRQVMSSVAPLVIGATALFSIAVLPRTRDMYDPSGLPNPGVAALHQLVSEIPSKQVAFATDMFHGDIAVLRLNLWRQFGMTEKQVSPLNPDLRDALDRGLVAYRPAVVSRIVERAIQGTTIILHPASRYRRAASYIAKDKVSVFSRVIGQHEFLVIDARNDLPSAVFQNANLPSVPDTQPVSITLPNVSGVPLSSLVPLRASYGFSEMRRNQTWGGSSIVINGVTHESGLGLHSPTTLRFAVPEGATSFQSIIAIDDDAQPCALGSARLTVRDQRQKVLHQTGVIASTTPTTVIVPLQGVSELELEIDDAGDGRDCDHVDLADALFVVPSGAPASCVCPKRACDMN